MGAIKTLKEVESALQKKNEANYVRALDAQGNPILISKEDLAEVVRGLLPVAYIRVEDVGASTIRIKAEKKKLQEFQFYIEIRGKNIGVSETHMFTNGVDVSFFNPYKILPASVYAKYKDFGEYYEYYVTHKGTFLSFLFRKMSNKEYIPEYNKIDYSEIPEDAIDITIS